MRLIQWCIFALLAGKSIVSGQATASISGTLIPELINTPIPLAYVTAMRSGLAPVSQTARAAANGSFQISALPAGTYTICVNATGFLNPCEWSLPTLIVTVGTGQSSTGNNLTIKPGTVAKLRIQDPSNLLSQKTAAGSNPNILAGVWTGKAATALLPAVLSVATVHPPTLPVLFHPVHQTGTDSAGANFEVSVPRNMPLVFHVTSGDVLLANSQGLPLASNVDQQSFQYSFATTTPLSFLYTVTGPAAGVIGAVAGK
jgi:hypothetical protein